MEFLPFFLVLLAAAFFSEGVQRLHLPWVVALILGGMVIGPGLGWQPGELIEFLGQVGLVFLMFMAGLETKLSGMVRNWRPVAVFSLFNGGLPFLVGLTIGWAFGLEFSGAILLGIIFISSAVAVVIPTLESNRLLGTRAGRFITPAAIFQDIFSLMLLAVFLQQIAPAEEGLAIGWFILLTAISVVALRILVPKVEWLLSLNTEHGKFEPNLRSLMVILLGTVIIFELLGLHPIVGGFFAGLILSDSLTNKKLRQKIHVVSYGLFIPIFFITIGANTDLSVLKGLGGILFLVIAVVLGSMLSKFISGWLGARLLGFSKSESSLIGTASLPQLSITLAVAYTGLELDLFGDLGQEMATALVMLTILTTFFTPIIIRRLAQKSDVTVV